MSEYLDLPDPTSIPLPEETIPLPTECHIPAPADIPPPPSPPPPPPPEEVPLPDGDAPPQQPEEVLQHYQRKTSPVKKRKRKRGTGDEDNLESSREESEMMARMLGFSNFDTTKGKMVPGNQVGAVHVVKKRRYRQYMNRKGGFNRPLDKVA